MEIPDELVEDYRLWKARDRLYIKVKDRSINARIACDEAQAAGQRILSWILEAKHDG